MNRYVLWLVVFAGACDMEDPPATRFRIAEGAEAATCQFPNAVAVDADSCGGTIIHPRVVAMDAGCGDDFVSGARNRIWLGELAGTPSAWASTEACWTHPNADPVWGVESLTVCRLEEPVAVPVAPPLHIEEGVELVPGTELTVVGFGVLQQGIIDEQWLSPIGRGLKRVATLTAYGVNAQNNTIQVGAVGDDVRTCYGDRGGPAMLQLPSGAWRVVGIGTYWNHSGEGVDVCDASTHQYGLLTNRLDWIEEVAGVDIHPCFDAGGTPTPSDECDAAGFSLHEAGRIWEDDCVGEVAGDSGSSAGESTSQTPGSSSDDGGPSETMGESEGTSGSGEDSSGGTGGQDSDEGCACAMRSRDGTAGLLALCLIVLGASRRW